ncbi:hypothetical protein PWT90_08170 [Aphanocladium album]|nr:hypothetical protein PWT90_08170 [Aphanocladium album]
MRLPSSTSKGQNHQLESAREYITRLLSEQAATNFVVPSSVSLKMKQLCRDLEEELATASDVVNPFSLAAKHSLELARMYLFLDGNGRMCRIILNAIQFRFAGIFVAMGEDDADEEKYLDIKKSI